MIAYVFHREAEDMPYTVVMLKPYAVHKGTKMYQIVGVRSLDDGVFPGTNTRVGYLPYRVDRKRKGQLGERVTDEDVVAKVLTLAKAAAQNDK